MERMKLDDQVVIEKTKKNLTDYSLIGLRTLLLAKRTIP